MTRKRTQNSCDRRPRTVSISLRNRGQTTQDFAVGIGVFILAVAFVFSFLPSILTPFDSSVTGGQTAQADRIADRVVHNLSVSTDSPNEINGTQFQADYAANDDNLTERLGLREDQARYDQVNIRFENLDGRFDDSDLEENWTAGDDYNNQSAASSARIVTVDHSDFNDPDEAAYRLVVRVW